MKKTIQVEQIKNKINEALKRSTCEPDVRNGMIFALEEILFATGNYNGYKHLLESDVPQGHLPGINYEVNAAGMFVPESDYGKRFFNTDETRRYYYQIPT